jgi:hypothetical protein
MQRETALIEKKNLNKVNNKGKNQILFIDREKIFWSRIAIKKGLNI